jgi:broad specificity polyphosphatase/5'/3'-nucleotidase SurE
METIKKINFADEQKIQLLTQIAQKPIVIGNDDGILELNVWELKLAISKEYTKHGLTAPKIIMCVPKGHASAQGSFTHLDDGEEIPKAEKFKHNTTSTKNSETTILDLFLRNIQEEQKVILLKDIYYYEGRPADLGYIIQNDKVFKDIKEIGMVISGPNNQQNYGDEKTLKNFGINGNLAQAGTVGIQNIIGLNKNKTLNKFQNATQISLSNIAGMGLNKLNNVAKLNLESREIFDNHCINSILYAQNIKNQHPNGLKDTIFNFNFNPLKDSQEIGMHKAIKNLHGSEKANHVSFLKPINPIENQHHGSISNYPDDEKLINSIKNLESEIVSKECVENMLYQKQQTNSAVENQKENSNKILDILKAILNFLLEVISYLPKKAFEMISSCLKSQNHRSNYQEI